MAENDIEVTALAYAKAFYGENFDPFMNPEAFDLARKATVSALTALRSTTAKPNPAPVETPKIDFEAIKACLDHPSDSIPTDSAAKDAEIARLQRCLDSRDMFIVERGLWGDYTDTLPKTRAALANRGEAGA